MRQSNQLFHHILQHTIFHYRNIIVGFLKHAKILQVHIFMSFLAQVKPFSYLTIFPGDKPFDRNFVFIMFQGSCAVLKGFMEYVKFRILRLNLDPF